MRRSPVIGKASHSACSNGRVAKDAAIFYVEDIVAGRERRGATSLFTRRNRRPVHVVPYLGSIGARASRELHGEENRLPVQKLDGLTFPGG
jgi:hypothetical protein